MAEGPRGWQPDPFEVHELRYIAMNGIPTRLVSDQGIRSFDPPPRSDPLAYSAQPSTSTSVWTSPPAPAPPPFASAPAPPRPPAPAQPLPNETAQSQEAMEQPFYSPQWIEPPSGTWMAESAPPLAVNDYEAPLAPPNPPETNLAPASSKSGPRAICSACGTTLHNGSTFCYACGQKQ
jgi:hypothetical protein